MTAARYYRVDRTTGRVLNVEKFDPEAGLPLAENVELVACDSERGRTLSWTGPVPATLAERKDALKRRVAAEADARRAQGCVFDFGGETGRRRLDLRSAADKLNWTALRLEAGIRIADGDGAATTLVRDADDNPAFPVSWNSVKAFTAALLGWDEKIRQAKWSLDEAIDAARDSDALDRIDLGEGWP